MSATQEQILRDVLGKFTSPGGQPSPWDRYTFVLQRFVEANLGQMWLTKMTGQELDILSKYLAENFEPEELLLTMIVHASILHRHDQKARLDQAQFYDKGQLANTRYPRRVLQAAMANGQEIIRWAAAAVGLLGVSDHIASAVQASVVGLSNATAQALGDIVSDYSSSNAEFATRVLSAALALGSAIAYTYETLDPENAPGGTVLHRAYDFLMIDPDIGEALSDAWEGPFITHLITMLQQCAAGDQLELSKAQSISGEPWPQPEQDSKAWKLKWCQWVNTELRFYIAQNLRVTVAKSSRKMLARAAGVAPSALGNQQWQNSCDPKTFTDLGVWHSFLKQNSE